MGNITKCHGQPRGWEPKESFDCPDKGPIPKPIGKFGVDKLQGRKVLEVCHYMGSYGMGGPGFFGLKLSGRSGGEPIWLVLTLWGADEWLILNDEPIAVQGNDSHRSDVTGKLVGKTLEWAKVQPKYSQMRFGDGTNTGNYKAEGLQLELHPSPSKRGRRPNGELRELERGESLLDAWVVSKDEWLYV